MTPILDLVSVTAFVQMMPYFLIMLHMYFATRDPCCYRNQYWAMWEGSMLFILLGNLLLPMKTFKLVQ